MEPEGTLQCSQKLAIGFCPDPGKSSFPHRSLSPQVVLFPSLRSCQRISPGHRRFETFLNVIDFYGEMLLHPRSTLKFENHRFSGVHDCLFNIFVAALHIWRPSPPSATWRRAMPWWCKGPHLILVSLYLLLLLLLLLLLVLFVLAVT
jgi:hypothetical protein